MKKTNNSSASGIVLFAKQAGCTSFNSLYTIKHSLKTNKVGHTGTLDSFAEGLLVVCVGSLTRLAGIITAFNKSYEAIIKFGEETDTLDPTGNVVKTAKLPTLYDLQKSLEVFKGDLMQAPPAFSAVHVNGKRASELSRQGKTVDIPKRPIKVFDSKIVDIQFEDEKAKTVKYAKIVFDVSKGTYIRCLARDIAESAGSCGHLVGLFRTKVGSFDIKDSAGFSLLEDFTIQNVVSRQQNQVQDNEEFLQEEVKSKIQKMTQKLALECGLGTCILKSEAEDKFFNGKPLRSNNFLHFREIGGNLVPAETEESNAFREILQNGDSPNSGESNTFREITQNGDNHTSVETGESNTFREILQNGENHRKVEHQSDTDKYAVFTKSEEFCGVVSKCDNKIKYEYVIPRVGAC